MKKKELTKRVLYQHFIVHSFCKAFLLIKYTIILTVIFTINVTAKTYSQAEKIDLDVRDMALKQVLPILERKGNIRMIYSEDGGAYEKTVNIQVKEMPVLMVLEKLLLNTNLEYKEMSEDFVVIRNRTEQQELTVSGIVRDARGIPLEGVSVLTQGTSKGMGTDEKGRYAIATAPNSTLIFSSIGYVINMLEQLETAIGQLDPSKTSYGISDPIYERDVRKWATFGYSLMLRLGMRMSNVDPVQSRARVEKAIASGIFSENAQSAMVRHQAGNGNTQNWDSFELKRVSFPESNQGKGLVKLGETLIDALKDRNDPRLPFYATLWQGNILAQQKTVLAAATDPTLQKGLPTGHDQNTIQFIIPNFSTSMLVEFSEPNTATIASLEAPTVIMSYAEVESLLAETALREWIPGPAKFHYEKAITANMQMTDFFPHATLSKGSSIISQSAIETYLAANSLVENSSFELQM